MLLSSFEEQSKAEAFSASWQGRLLWEIHPQILSLSLLGYDCVAR
jgi:hypothetical protein